MRYKCPRINEHSQAGASRAGPGWAGLRGTEEETPSRAPNMCFLTREYSAPTAAPPSLTAPVTPASPTAPTEPKPPLKPTLPTAPAAPTTTAPTAPRPPTPLSPLHTLHPEHPKTHPTCSTCCTHTPRAPCCCSMQGTLVSLSPFGVSAPSPGHAAATIPGRSGC